MEASFAKKYFALSTTLLLGGMMACNSIAPNSSGEGSVPDTYKQKYRLVYEHYGGRKDTLKLKALDFILQNLTDQYYLVGQTLDKYNQVISLSKDKSLAFLSGKLDSVASIYGTDFTKMPDDDLISDSFLVKSIDDAFKEWGYRWNRQVGFRDFCEYILPYKIADERPENWRSEAASDFKGLRDSLRSEENPFKLASIINDRLSWFRINLNFNYPTDMGYNMTKGIGAGSCYTSSRLAMFPMRYFGLPVVIDYAPAWGNRSSGHWWDALMYGGKPYPFDAAEANIGYYKIQFRGVDRMDYKLAKVFRKTFSIQRDELGSLHAGDEEIPPLLDNRRIMDVTGQYVPVSDVTLFYGNRDFGKKYGYLCVFDDANWVPIYWGMMKDAKITFQRMGRDLVYLPAVYRKGKVDPICDPFILYKDGRVRDLQIDSLLNQKLTVYRKYPEDESNRIEIGDTYELFYWNRGWRSLGIQSAAEKWLTFSGVPGNTLFWLRDLTKGKEERIFTYENNKQVWW